MQHFANYKSPLGDMLIAADDLGITGAWFYGAKYFARGVDRIVVAKQGCRAQNDVNDAVITVSGDLPETVIRLSSELLTPILKEAFRWFDVYFEGSDPGPLPPLNPKGTEFQKVVWAELLRLPYGSVCTYGDIARRIADLRGLKSMSAQAVGGAVGRNPVSVMIPCHRVIGADGSLTGYAGGTERKEKLLGLEGIDLSAPAIKSLREKY